MRTQKYENKEKGNKNRINGVTYYSVFIVIILLNK